MELKGLLDGEWEREGETAGEPKSDRPCREGHESVQNSVGKWMASEPIGNGRILIGFWAPVGKDELGCAIQ